MTTHREGAANEAFWRRPAEEAPADAPPDPAGRQPAYPGPPSAPPPAPDWRPPVFMQPPPPRQLPAQDLARLEAEERRARTLTYGVGVAAGLVLLAVLCLLCSRVVL